MNALNDAADAGDIIHRGLHTTTNNQGTGTPSSVIKPAPNVRMPDPMFSTFLKELLVFPEELLEASKSMVEALRKKWMLKGIAFADGLKELCERPLSDGEMVACIQWWINTSQQNPNRIDDVRREMLSATVLTVGSPGDGNEPITLSGGIQTFLNARNIFIPTDGPLPDHLLPMGISRGFDPTQLQKHPQWRE